MRVPNQAVRSEDHQHPAPDVNFVRSISVKSPWTAFSIHLQKLFNPAHIGTGEKDNCLRVGILLPVLRQGVDSVKHEGFHLGNGRWKSIDRDVVQQISKGLVRGTFVSVHLALASVEILKLPLPSHFCR